jgi:hypothetical protein
MGPTGLAAAREKYPRVMEFNATEMMMKVIQWKL